MMLISRSQLCVCTCVYHHLIVWHAWVGLCADQSIPALCCSPHFHTILMPTILSCNLEPSHLLTVFYPLLSSSIPTYYCDLPLPGSPNCHSSCIISVFFLFCLYRAHHYLFFFSPCQQNLCSLPNLCTSSP